jgi:hypothetical protein
MSGKHTQPDLRTRTAPLAEPPVLTDYFYRGKSKKVEKGAETIAAAFTDHHAVTIRMTLDTQGITRRNNSWKMNTTLLDEHLSVHTLRSNGRNGRGMYDTTRPKPRSGKELPNA